MWYNGSMKLEATELKESIADAVQDYANKKQQDGVKSLSRMDPEKVGLILYLFCLGVSQSQMVKRHKICHKTIKHTLMEYADHLGKWSEVGARPAKQLSLNLQHLLSAGVHLGQKSFLGHPRRNLQIRLISQIVI